MTATSVSNTTPSINVAKFGGTSVANFEAMSRCVAIVAKNPNTKILVSSACSGVTNLLVELANGVSDDKERESLFAQIKKIHLEVLNRLQHPEAIEPQLTQLFEQLQTLARQSATKATTQRTDAIVACGELASTYLLTQICVEQGISAVRVDIRDVLRTDSKFGKAMPQLDEIKRLASEKLVPLCQDHLVITQGFIGSDSEGNTTTLGRGGSDYSAALIAEAVGAIGLEIWTDVPGIYTTDPRIAPKAAPIPEISFIEASEMANFGAKILHPATLIPALRQHIPVFVGSSKAPELGGTWVRKEVESKPLFRAIALRSNQTMVTLHSTNMFQAYGFLAKVFEILARHQISVDLITTSEVSVSLTLDQTDTSGGAPELPVEAREELEALCEVKVEHDLCLVALIGNQMSSSRGSAKQVFGTLEDFNLRMICYGASPHNLCFLLHKSESQKAVQKLHESLFE